MVEGYTEPRENSPDTKNTVVCEVKNFPASPPIVFESIPLSVIPTPRPKPTTICVIVATRGRDETILK